uniref:Uncharacterized protein n=1 Tax=Lactuca sativa TaxID=4236 RepID=A0A9R1UQZ6_LACSA|nr:hypothetical protein LSAT_V11C800420570 [Lactuca sativa]
MLLLEASPELWQEKIKVDKDFAKFRDTNLSIYEIHYAPFVLRFCCCWRSNYDPVTISKQHQSERCSTCRKYGGQTRYFLQTNSSKRKKPKDIANNPSNQD